MIPTSPKHAALCLVLRLPLSCCAWCHEHCCGCQRRAVWVLQLLVSRCVGVAAAIVTLCVVSWALSSRRAWCHGRCCHAARGVVGAVVTHHTVSWSRSSHRVWCCGHGRRAVWCCGRGGCCRTVWHCGRGRHRRRIVIAVGGWAVVGPGGRGRLCVRLQR
jgi:hypothetical protein